MMCGNAIDFIDHPLPKDFVSAHGASHHVWTPGPPPSKSGTEPMSYVFTPLASILPLCPRANNCTFNYSPKEFKLQVTMLVIYPYV